MEVARGTVYQPEGITLMKTVLEESATFLPAARRTCAMKARLAAHILDALDK